MGEGGVTPSLLGRNGEKGGTPSRTQSRAAYVVIPYGQVKPTGYGDGAANNSLSR